MENEHIQFQKCITATVLEKKYETSKVMKRRIFKIKDYKIKRLQLSATIISRVQRYDGTNRSVSDSLYKAIGLAKVTTSSEALTSVADILF